MGFSMVRKHVKMEPRRWYFHTDTLGLLVWQDVPSKRSHEGLGNPAYDQWLAEMEREVDARAGHPSIVQWVTYNEGWGQTVNDAGATVRHTVGVLRAQDTTRLIDDASGGRGPCRGDWGTNGFWHGGCYGDVTDVHTYSPPDPDIYRKKESAFSKDVSQRDRSKALVIGEYGGIMVSAARAAARAASQNVASGVPLSHAPAVCIYLVRMRLFLCFMPSRAHADQWAPVGKKMPRR